MNEPVHKSESESMRLIKTVRIREQLIRCKKETWPSLNKHDSITPPHVPPETAATSTMSSLVRLELLTLASDTGLSLVQFLGT